MVSSDAEFRQPPKRLLRYGAEADRWQVEPDLASLADVLLISGVMNETGLALFVLVGFIVPVPILVWLDRPTTRRQGG